MNSKTWYLTLLVVAIALIGEKSRQADAAIVTDDLLLWLDAGNAGNGVGVLGSGATWHDLSSSGTHDTALVGAYSWLGTGTPADPFRVNFTQTPPYVYPSSAQAYGRVANSGEATELDTTIFTYEVWAEINGPGTGEGNSEVFFPGVGTLIGHASDSQYGNGGISYTTGGSWGTPPDRLFGGNADYGGSETPFPNSGGLIGDGLLHHIVHTRAGAGATDSAWYLDGVLQGTFATTAKESYADLGIGANHRSGFQAVFDKGANADFAQVRVYDRALTAAEVLQNFNAGLTQAGIFDPADFNHDSLVDGNDLAKWQGDYGVNGNSDADGDGDSDGRDFLIWQRSIASPLSAVAAVPEPSTFGLLTVATGFGLARRRKRKV